MGWAHCGTDSQGRDIGYGVSALCDHPGCTKEIDRGLAFVCGTMHGEDEVSCEKYFCEDHRQGVVVDEQGRWVAVCKPCEALWEQYLEDNDLRDPREEDERADRAVDERQQEGCP